MCHNCREHRYDPCLGAFQPASGRRPAKIPVDHLAGAWINTAHNVLALPSRAVHAQSEVGVDIILTSQAAFAPGLLGAAAAVALIMSST